MAAKAWYKPSALPQLIARFDPPPPSSSSASIKKKSIEVWTTTCIVTNFGMQRGTNSKDVSNVSSKNNSNNSKSDDNNEKSYPNHPRCSMLLNPANPNLTGPNTFPYFPRGGPQPQSMPNRPAHHIMGYVSQWGGMDVGNGMLFSAEAIDGLVHQLGGLRLRAECSLVPTHEYAHVYVNQQQPIRNNNNNNNNKSSNISNQPNTTKDEKTPKCPVGTAVMTSPGNEDLRNHYDSLIHTTPPFYNYPPSMTDELKQTLGILPINKEDDDELQQQHSWSRELLRSCYRHSFHLAFERLEEKNSYGSSLFRNPMGLFGFGKPDSIATASHHQQLSKRMAVPLLGAGCRDFPKEVALDVAALEGASWLSSNNNGCDPENGDMSVVFGLLEETDAEALAERLERELF